MLISTKQSVGFNFDNLEHQRLADKLDDPEDQKLFEEFESRIRKTESGQDTNRRSPQKQLEDSEQEESEEEEYDPEKQREEKSYSHHFKPSPGPSPYDYQHLQKTKVPESFEEESSQADQKYDEILESTYQKARKYKKKAKKLYSNLQRLKSHYEKAKARIAQLEYENTTLTEKMMVFSGRVDELEHAYNDL